MTSNRVRGIDQKIDSVIVCLDYFNSYRLKKARASVRIVLAYAFIILSLRKHFNGVGYGCKLIIDLNLFELKQGGWIGAILQIKFFFVGRAHSGVVATVVVNVANNLKVQVRWPAAVFIWRADSCKSVALLYDFACLILL